MSEEIPTGRPLRLLHMLYARGKPTATYTLTVKQSELAKQLSISRQALNVHLRKLRDQGHISIEGLRRLILKTPEYKEVVKKAMREARKEQKKKA